MLEVPWLQEVDWKDWMDSSMALPEGHSTIAYEVPAEETIDKLANLKHSNLSEVRRLHRDILKRGYLKGYQWYYPGQRSQGSWSV